MCWKNRESSRNDDFVNAYVFDDSSYVPNDENFTVSILGEIKGYGWSTYLNHGRNYSIRILHIKSELLRCWTCAPLGCTCDNALKEALAKTFPPLVHFHRWKKMLQINLGFIGLSVCLISLCSSLIGLCACLITISQKKAISTGILWEKLVEKMQSCTRLFHFFHKHKVIVRLSRWDP